MNRKLPDYYLTKDNITFFLIFVFIFSLIFVNVFTPFQGAWYNMKHYSRLQLFTDTLLIVTGGSVIMTMSRILMYHINKRFPLTHLRFWLWQIAEILLIASLYTIICHYVVGDERDFSEIFARSLIYIPLILIIPIAISILYFGIKDKDEKITALNDFVAEDMVLDNHITAPKNSDTEQIAKSVADVSTQVQTIENATRNRIINFFDERDELQISLKTSNIYYLESAENYVHIYYKNKENVERYTLRNTLKKQQEKLEKNGFIRCHRSYLVNFSNIMLLRKDKDGPYLDFGVSGISQIPVSKTYLESVTTYFIQNSDD